MSASTARTSRMAAASRTAPAVPGSDTSSGHSPTPFCARLRQSNFSPGSCFRSGATSLWATTLRAGIGCRDRMARPRSHTAASCSTGKSRVAPLVARVDDLDADRAVVQPTVPPPVRHAGMCGAPLLRHQTQHRAILVHHVVRGHARRRIAQPVDRLPHGPHASVMKNQHIDRGARRPFILVRARQIPDAQAHKPRSRLIRSQAALIRATFSLARAMNSAGTPRAARLSGWFSRISCLQVARISSAAVERDTPSTV